MKRRSATHLVSRAATVRDITEGSLLLTETLEHFHVRRGRAVNVVPILPDDSRERWVLRTFDEGRLVNSGFHLRSGTCLINNACFPDMVQ